MMDWWEKKLDAAFGWIFDALEGDTGDAVAVATFATLFILYCRC